MLIEVKERKLTLTQINAKLDKARSQKISEIIFMAQRGIEGQESEQIQDKISKEFSSGQNVYITDLSEFSTGIFMLLGEEGRVIFINKVGEELDRAGSSIVDRRAWAQLLRET